MGFSKALKCSNKPVNRGAMILEHSACAECGKNEKIILLVRLTSVLTQKSNA